VVSELLRYGKSGVMSELVARVVAEYMPELVARLTGPTGGRYEGDIDTTLVAIAAPPGLTTTSAERRIAQARSMVEVGSAASIRPGSIRIAPIENTRAVILFAPTRHQSCCRS
jgi:hypothetical protein